MLSEIFQDWEANAGNSKARVILPAFRLASFLARSRGILRLIGIPYCYLYRVIVGWGLGIELPLVGVVGSGLRLYHGQGLVIHELVTIGSNVVLRHGTTIGVKESSSGDLFIPTICDSVDVGANSVIIGAVVIGEGACIGAGSVVTKSVPPNVVVAGNPARYIKQKTEYVTR